MNRADRLDAPPRLHAPPRAVSWRSVGLGLVGVTLVCGLTPYNDYALANTFLVGNNLPLGVVMLTFLFTLFVNGPLSRWRPDWALTSGEVAVAFSMTLVSCALPSSGLMRYLPATLVMPFWNARSNAEFLDLLVSFDLSHWLFPSFAGDDVRHWLNDPLVDGWRQRWTVPGEPIPLLAWVRPAVAWGVFLAGLYGAHLCVVALVRHQWFENERLPFPLAQIQLAIVEQPARGRWLNETFSRRSFWVAGGAVFALHTWNGLSRYWPQYFQEIWVWYDLNPVMSERPWIFLDSKVRDAAIFFSAMGVTYFLSSPVAFSLWFFYLAHNVYRMSVFSAGNEAMLDGTHDQHFGGLLAFAGVIFWVGRRHWRLVVAQAFRGPRPGEPRGRYLSYPLAFWGLVGCTVLMIGWLVAAGATVFGAAVMVVLLLLLFLLITRIIAETGLIHGQLQVPIYKPWTFLAAATDVGHAVPTKTFFLGSFLQAQHYDFREVVPVYASHGLKVTDHAVFGDAALQRDDAAERSTGRRIIACLALALLVGYVVSFASMVWTEYTYAATKDMSARFPINDWGSEQAPNMNMVLPTVQYEKLNYHPRHSPVAHMSFGFGLTGLLAFLRLRYTWWPLHPIGYLMIGTFPGAHLWFSIFAGWLCKVLIVRFGGARMYTGARPFFIGLIVGESAAAGFWLLVGIVLSTLGYPYRPVLIMPS